MLPTVRDSLSGRRQCAGSSSSSTRCLPEAGATRLALSTDSAEWARRVDRGLVQVSTVTLLQLGFSARSGASWREGMRGTPLASMPLVNLTPRTEARAVEVQGLLAMRGHHRAVEVPGLLIAATAELAGVIVLHLDEDFDLIAEVTGQDVERLIGDF